MLVSDPLATVQGVHPGPLNVTTAVFGSKPVPVIVKVNPCWFTGGFGAVVNMPNCGADPLELTASMRLFDGTIFGPFCTVIVKAPAAARVALPLKAVEVLLVRSPLGMVQGAQFGPLNVTSADVGSNPLPLIANVNWVPATAEVGTIPVSWGPTPMDMLFDAAPPGPFCTFTTKLPAANVIAPLSCVAVLVTRAALPIVHGVGAHPGPDKDSRAVAGSKPVPLTASVKAC